ncbi:hypothetical protein [Corallococcus sp. Z5C101001]|uniref:hypothetical protein n=1 Tax=Corallococcus sp. Z5C101001 TaxID=2596829 RepID=UPI00117C66BC|nr:hypothetical protein [Corallococcus sp. Z5C101001]TSC29565.1 hypothetical protein FOF48_16860 [Corallococcus sp. Z5C101001]
MKTLSIRAFGAAVFAIAGLTVGCGGAPEDMTAPEGEAPGGTPIAQVYTGQAIDVSGVSGAWFYAYHPASGLFGYTLSTYDCS